MTEVSREENVGTLHIARIHMQLRRLLKHSNFCDNIILTAIPEHRSSVLFTFSYDSNSTVSSTSSQQPGSPRRRLSRQSSRDWRDDPLMASIGFIMMECGLEDVSITAVRRLGYKVRLEVGDISGGLILRVVGVGRVAVDELAGLWLYNLALTNADLV